MKLPAFHPTHPSARRTLLALASLGLAAQMRAQAPAARPAAEDVLVLTPFTVDAARDVGFVAASALAGGRLATDLKDTPVAYSVLTREFIDALGVSDVTEAAQWTTNASFAKDDGRSTQFGRVGFNDLVTFRGVPANRAQVNFFPVHFDYDSFNLERFDFARGPNSILFGTRQYDVRKEAVAVILRDVANNPAQLEIRLRDGSVLKPASVRSQAGELAAQDSAAGALKIPASDVATIQRRNASSKR